MGAQTSPGLSDEKAARILVAFREGRTLKPFSMRAGQFEAYCKAHPEYARDALPLLDANRKAANQRKGARIRGKTHSINGHSFAEYARVAVHKGWTTRQCRACEQMRYRRGGLMKAEILEMVTARIIAGSSLSSFTKAGQGGGYLLRYDTLARHRRENLEFDHFVIDATKDNKSKGSCAAGAESGTMRSAIRTTITTGSARCCRQAFRTRTMSSATSSSRCSTAACSART
jgi:hypothetical protein